MDAMSKTLNEMVHAIVDYCGTISGAADEIGVHYNTLDRLLKDETATAQAGTMEKIEAIYERITYNEEDWEEEPEEEPEEKITKLEVGKTYEIRIPKGGQSGKVMTLIKGKVKGEYRQFYHLDDNGNNVTVLKNDLVNDRTTVRLIDEPAEAIVEEPVDAECAPAVEEPEEITEEPAEEELTEEPVDAPTVEGYEATLGGAPTIIGTTPAERLHSCLFIVELCDQKIAEAEKAKKDRAAILPMMDKIYEEFRGRNFDGNHD